MKRISILSNILIFLILVCTGMKCKESELPVTLPEATHSGKDTMGALIDGKIWVSGCKGLFCLSTVDGRNSSYGFSLEGHDSTTYVKIDVAEVKGPGQYPILPRKAQVSLEDAIGMPADSGSTQAIFDYRTNTTHTGTLTITYFDPKNHIASGTFEFQAANAVDENKIMQVTSGRFDALIVN